jgi:predicted phage terminase large subunit-like protein
MAKITASEAAKELLRRRGVRKSLAEFARSQGLEPAAHHLLLIDELEALERGDNDFLIVEMPPGSAKSSIVNWLFPAWCLARRPGLNILTASHSSELAERWGRKTRNLVQSSSALLGVGVASDSSAAYRWHTTNGCEYYAAGAGVGIMGFRASCLAGSTIIQTNHGHKRIDDLKICAETYYVLSYDDASNSCTYKRVVAIARRKAETIWRIRTSSGNVVEATGEHRFWTSGGWREASSLSVGDVLMCAMRGVRRARGEVKAEPDIVSVVERICRECDVWDIQVEGTSCFFANGVLVHNCGIIDDPFGSREDAESKRIRDSRWEWYVNDFSSRLKPGAFRVIMHQRFHEDDLAGRVIAQLDSIGKPYRRLKIRAEAVEGDILGRAPGEMLWDDPNGYNYGQFLRDRKAECDARTWSALYQQEPIPDTGDYFRREWLVPVDAIPPVNTLRLYGASDYAVTGGGGDYTVHGVIGIDPDGEMYLVDLWRKQAASDEWVEAWCDLVKKWRPMEWAEETGQIKSGVGPFLDRRARERSAYCPRTQFPTRGDKAVRAQSIRGRMASRGLRILANAPWRADFESELLRFPAGINDDIVDCIGLAGQLLDKMHVGMKPKATDPMAGRIGYGGPRRSQYDSSGITL